jgi:hypothetical protein
MHATSRLAAHAANPIAEVACSLMVIGNVMRKGGLGLLCKLELMAPHRSHDFSSRFFLRGSQLLILIFYAPKSAHMNLRYCDGLREAACIYTIISSSRNAPKPTQSRVQRDTGPQASIQTCFSRAGKVLKTLETRL